jgi:aubergine-like protein
MVIGIDVFETFEHGQAEKFLGFAASLDTSCTEYFSIACQLEQGNERVNMSVKLQEYLKEAILQFSHRNGPSLPPEHFIVYRASARETDWWAIKQMEIDAFRQLLTAMNNADAVGRIYNPKMTFIAIAKHTHMRFFTHVAQQIKNPEPGTAIDSALTKRPGIMTFYLVNQLVTKGTACPTQYTVLYDSFGLTAVALQSLTYRLSHLYFNVQGSIKMPAPAQYAKKIAHLTGTAVRAEPHTRLRCTFFYL